MSLAAVVLIAATLAGGVTGQPAQETLYFRVAAAKAVVEGHERPQFDRGIEWIRDAVSHLRQYDAFKTVLATSRHRAQMGSDTAIRLTSRYTFRFKPIETLDRGTKARLEVRIEETYTQPGRGPVRRNVVRSVVTAVRGDKVVIGGPDLDDGKLVLVFMVER